MTEMVETNAFLARQAIEAALARHSRGVDRADANMLGSAYHADATVDYGAFKGPAADFVAFLADAQKTAGASHHRTAPPSIRIVDKRAVSESYVIAYIEDDGIQRTVLGRYLDRWEERDGDWRLTHRTYSLERNRNLPGRSDRSDPPIAYNNFVPRGGHGAADAGRILLTRAQAANRGPKTMATQTDDAKLDEALSKVAIHELAMTYCRGVDRADKALLASIFSEDSTVISGVVNGTGAEFAETICEFVQGNLDFCFHSVANEWIEVSGDEAVGEHYIIAMVSAGGTDTMTGGRYIDRYVRTDGTWKIKERTFVVDWDRSDPSTHQDDGFYEGLEQHGRWGREDPVYALWSSLDR